MWTKEKIVRAVRGQLPQDSHWLDLSVDECVFRWFLSRRSARGLGLTQDGDDAFRSAEIEYITRPVVMVRDTIDPSGYTLLQRLQRKFDCPWYLYNVTSTQTGIGIELRIYDSGVAFWIDMCGGVAEYLQTNTKLE